MIKVDITGVQQTIAALQDKQKQMAYAAAVALTRTAKAVKDAMPALMNAELDRPTPFTTRGLFVTSATKASLTAKVGFMDRQAAYMQLQIAGGTRKPGPHGIKLPGDIVLNAFGNIPRGTIAKLKAAAEDGTLSKAIGRRLGLGDRRKGAAPVELFYGRPLRKNKSLAPLGIWRRVPGHPGKLVPVIIFTDKTLTYKPRFHFATDAERIIRAEWPGNFARAFDEAMRTAR